MQESIELTPVKNLQDKLQSKELLTKEELIVLSMAMNAKFSDLKSKPLVCLIV